MELLTLEAVRAEVERLARKIHAPAHALPTYGRTEDGARPHIEVDDRGYHWVVVERGKEYERVTTTSLDELLDRTFACVTHDMAFGYELAHRVDSQDCRRIAFRRQLELLEALSPAWAERRRREQEEILQRNPFNDRKDSC